MLRYKTKTRPGLVTLYDIHPGNGAGLFLQPWSLHNVSAKVRPVTTDNIYTQLYTQIKHTVHIQQCRSLLAVLQQNRRHKRLFTEESRDGCINVAKVVDARFNFADAGQNCRLPVTDQHPLHFNSIDKSSSSAG